MKKFGLVGGIGSGKSLVARLLAKLGAVVLDADRIGHDVLRQEDVKDAIRGRYESSVFDSNGEIDRKKLAKIVFAPTEQGAKELAFLNELTHPRITDEFQKRLAALDAKSVEFVVVDAPLLFESGWNGLTTKILFVDVPEEIRWQRCQKRGWSREHFDAREAAQWPVEKKRQLADYVIRNDGTEEELAENVRQFWADHVCQSRRRK